MLGKLVCTLLILISSSSLATTQVLHNLERSPAFNNVHLSKSDKKIANNFKKIFKLSNKNIINKSLVRSLHRDIVKSPRFKHLAPWTQNLLRLTKSKSYASTKKRCLEIQKQTSHDKLLSYLIQNSYDLCVNKLLEIQMKEPSKTLRFKKITNLIPPSKFKKFNSSIGKILSYSKGNKRSHLKNSEIITDYIISHKIIPNKDFLKTIKSNVKLTRHLQDYDLNLNSNKWIFYKEFKKLKDKAFNAIDEKKSSSEIESTYRNFYNYYQKINTLLPRKKSVATIMSLSKSYMRRSYFKKAEYGFNQVLKLQSYDYANAIFNAMWSKYLQNNKSEAFKILNEHTKSTKILRQNSKLHFWKGKLASELGNPTDAIKTFKNVINFNPLSFYAILSAKELAKSNEAATKFHYLSNLPIDEKERIKSNRYTKRWIKRTTLWSQFNLHKFVNLEIQNLKDKFPNKSLNAQIKNLAFNLAKKNEYLNSFKVLYKSINRKYVTLDESTLKILFPKPFLNQIKKASTDFDPIIALSLIRQESGFNKYARSHVGARGLMQLMPNTARQFRRRLKSKHLYNPSLNIKIGTKYFNKLLDNYDNNLVYSLAAYNAGERRVNEWQQEYMTSDNILKNIENIPFLETRKYVKLIFRNIFFYKMILDQKKTDTQAFNKIYDIHLGFEG